MIGRAAATFLLVVAVSACGRGGDDETSAGTDASVSTVATTTTAVPPTPAPPAEVLYVVQAGDSLSAIASRFGVSVDEIANANAIEDVNRLAVGRELVIPPSTSTTTTATSGAGSSTTLAAGSATTLAGEGESTTTTG